MNNNTYTLFLPENEDGAVWSKKNMDKEAALLTIKLNINKDNMISNEIIKRNKNNIREYPKVCVNLQTDVR